MAKASHVQFNAPDSAGLFWFFFVGEFDLELVDHLDVLAHRVLGDTLSQGGAGSRGADRGCRARLIDSVSSSAAGADVAQPRPAVAERLVKSSLEVSGCRTIGIAQGGLGFATRNPL